MNWEPLLYEIIVTATTSAIDYIIFKISNVNFLDMAVPFFSILSSIATAVMAILTYLMLRQSKKDSKQNENQIKKTEEKQKELERARLYISVFERYHAFYLKIANIGKETAYNINLNISTSLYSDDGNVIQIETTNLDDRNLKENHQNVVNASVRWNRYSGNLFYFIKSFHTLEAGKALSIQIADDYGLNKDEIIFLDEILKRPITISGSYCGGVYQIEKNVLYISEIRTRGATVIKEGIEFQISSLNCYLDDISKSIEEFRTDVKEKIDKYIENKK